MKVEDAEDGNVYVEGRLFRMDDERFAPGVLEKAIAQFNEDKGSGFVFEANNTRWLEAMAGEVDGPIEVRDGWAYGRIKLLRGERRPAPAAVLEAVARAQGPLEFGVGGQVLKREGDTIVEMKMSHVSIIPPRPAVDRPWEKG